MKGILLIGDGKFDEFWDEWLSEWTDKEGPYTFTKDHLRSLIYYAWYESRCIQAQVDHARMNKLRERIKELEDEKQQRVDDDFDRWWARD